MNFSDETVEKVADVILEELYATQEGIAIDPKIVAKAALSSLTLADLMQVDEVREMIRALEIVGKQTELRGSVLAAICREALTPFTKPKEMKQ